MAFKGQIPGDLVPVSGPKVASYRFLVLRVVDGWHKVVCILRASKCNVIAPGTDIEPMEIWKFAPVTVAALRALPLACWEAWGPS